MLLMLRRVAVRHSGIAGLVVATALASCGDGGGTTSQGAGAGGAAGGGPTSQGAGAGGAAGDRSLGAGGSRATGSGGSGGTSAASGGPVVAGCSVFPANHIFNTPIDTMPVHASNAAFLSSIGSHRLHLDLGQSMDMSHPDTYWGIPYNVVHGSSLAWSTVAYHSTDGDMSWDPTAETDCVDASSGAAHTIVSPCLSSAAPNPVLPIPASPLVEGGVDTDPSQPYGDHHLLLVDADACRLWELYHVYPRSGGGWDIFGSATFDLHSNALRPSGWTSADAAGFAIFPLLLRADEASSGAIRHALRFTIQSSKIRGSYVWPARHLASSGTSTSLPPMGQLFRLKASYAIPTAWTTQARAILQALKTYGMYIADGGSDMYIQGEPSDAWGDDTFSQVQSVASDDFEAIDLSSLQERAGFDPDSAAVPD